MTVSTHHIPDLQNAVDAGRMMQHLAEFACWTKLSGSADEASSLSYIERQLAAYGYRTTLLHHPAYISLPGPARLVVDGGEFTAITHSMARPSPPDGAVGPLVYLGRGTEADFDRSDLRGAVVLVEGMATPAVSLRASNADAVGQIHISPHEHLHEMCISPIWGSPDPRTVGLLPTTVVLTISLEDGNRLRDRLVRGEQPEVRLHARVDTCWRQTPILVADMASPEATAETPFILFSGHHDTWHRGVMDNGAANATMLEVARLCAATQGDWERGLRLCFWSGHSHGRYSGSAWYADANWHELETHCAAHVNVDSTGGIGALDVSRAPAATEFCALAREAMEAEAGQVHQGNRMSRNGDQSFWGIGIPSLFSIFSNQVEEEPGLRNNLGWWWHTPDDLIDKIDAKLLERDTRVYRYVVNRLLTAPVLPIDIAAQVDDLQQTLDQISLPQDTVSGFADLVAAVSALKEASIGLTESGDEPSAHKARQIDRTIMRISRRLVPLDYSSGDRFRHDLSLAQSKWPSLDPLRSLAASPTESEEHHLFAIEAQRTINRVRHAVEETLQILRQFT